MGPLSVAEPVYTKSSQFSQSEQEQEQVQEADDQIWQQPHNKSPLKCPRCDSTNTKFCYYNNYSRLQPRHFCRACRRHWTAGGTLRDVPFGGGCKYTKRRKMSPSSSFTAPSAAATSTAPTSESLTDTNNTSFPFVEPLFLQAQLPPLEYGIGSIFNEIGCNSESVYAGSSYDVMNLYNEGASPAWQLPDISAAGCWQETNDRVI